MKRTAAVIVLGLFLAGVSFCYERSVGFPETETGVVSGIIHKQRDGTLIFDDARLSGNNVPPDSEPVGTVTVIWIAERHRKYWIERALLVSIYTNFVYDIHYDSFLESSGKSAKSLPADVLAAADKYFPAGTKDWIYPLKNQSFSDHTRSRDLFRAGLHLMIAACLFISVGILVFRTYGIFLAGLRGRRGRCRKCGYLLADGSSTCPECGGRQPATGGIVADGTGLAGGTGLP